jgi:molecular chaperone DnaK
LLETRIQAEIEDAAKTNNKALAADLENTLEKVQDLIVNAGEISEDDVTEKKFQIADQKRNLAQVIFELTCDKRLDQAKADYLETRSEVQELVRESGNDRERHIVSEIFAREQIFLTSSTPEKILAIKKELEAIRSTILMRTPEFLQGMFQHLIQRRASMNDQIQVTQLIDSGRRAVENGDVDTLQQINLRLWDLMPATEKKSEEMRTYTGIV